MPLFCECGRPGCPGDLTCLEKAAPPLDAERVSELRRRAAALVSEGGGRQDWDCVAVGADTLLALCDHYLRATQRESGGVSERTPQSAREDLERGPGAWLSERESRLRTLLAFAYSGSQHLYGDDGELVDGRLPFIDYMRDSVEEIEKAMEARGMAALSASQRKETPTP